MVFAKDIGAITAAVLEKRPEKHGGKDYWLSTEVLTGPQVAELLSEAAGRDIKCNVSDATHLEKALDNIPSASVRAYMESAVITMILGTAGKIQPHTESSTAG